MFHNLLDSVGFNSNIPKILRSRTRKHTHQKSVFEKLEPNLVNPLMRERLQIPTVPKELRVVIEFGINTGRCSFCPRKRDRKS